MLFCRGTILLASLPDASVGKTIYLATIPAREDSQWVSNIHGTAIPPHSAATSRYRPRVTLCKGLLLYGGPQRPIYLEYQICPSRHTIWYSSNWNGSLPSPVSASFSLVDACQRPPCIQCNGSYILQGCITFIEPVRHTLKMVKMHTV